MSKNANKKAKFKEVTFTINKGKFKKLLSLILKHNQKYDANYRNIINGVKIRVKGNLLTLAATDGNSLLELQTEIEETVAKEVQAVLVGVHLEKLALKKDYYQTKRVFAIFDLLQITIKEESTVIDDVKNQIQYNIPHYTRIEDYPDYEKLFPKDIEKNENYIKVGVNMALLSKLSELTKNGMPAIIAVNKNPTSAIIVKSDNDGIKSRSLIMPCHIREN